MDIRNINLFLFDMDGTLYLGERLFPFTKDLLATIKKQGKRYFFITNNSSKSAADYVKKMARLGIMATEDDFVTSAATTAHYLKARYPHKRYYVCGTHSLVEEFRKAELSVTDTRDGHVDAVVLGFDTELTFKKIEDVTILLTENPDMLYVATHPDTVCPTEYGSIPDCGALAELLAHSVHRMPQIIGKPEPLIVELAMEKACAAKETTLVIGDRLYTDIACGQNAGTKTLLVYSGEATPADCEKAERKPTYTAADCGELLAALQSS